MDPIPEELAALDREVERQARGLPKLEPGAGGLAVAVGVLVLLIAFALPWVGPHGGWQILSGASGLGLLPRLFTITAVLFGVVGSGAALTTRLWPIGWACALGCGFSVVNGLWAIWSRQTAQDGGPGPGPGLLLAVVSLVFLTTMWVRLAWSRPGGRANG